MDFVGARWWKFDFHTHSPASFDYGRGDKGVRDSITPRDWLIGYIEKGIECVAVTDHNTGDWIDKLKKEAAKLSQEGYTIHVFPGVEVTANSNIHVLGIFDPSATSADINSVIGACKFRGTKGDSDSVAEESAENVVKEIVLGGGVAIPAHIDMKAGLCQQTSSHTIRQVCDHANAVEIIFPDQERNDAPLSKYLNLGVDLPSVIGSDAHLPTQVGRAYTWVKMSSPSIEGLKLALVDGSSSLIRSTDENANPNRASNTLLRSVTVEKAKYAGRSSPLTIQFNPWLNSIIGGRGSGKSSVLEFIRIGMDRARDIYELTDDNEIRRSLDSFMKISRSRDSEGVMLDETRISCIYTRDDVWYRLTWDRGSNDVAIDRYDGESWVREEGAAHSRFPIKIFSQKQIFNLAKNPNTLLRLIDESSTVDFQQWKMDWSEKKSHFQTLCSQRRELESRLSNKSVLLGQLSDVEQKIKTIEKSGHRSILTNFQEFRSKRVEIEQYEADIERFKVQIANAVNSMQKPQLELSRLNLELGMELEVKIRLQQLDSSASSFRNEVENAVERMERELTSFKEWYESSEFNTAHVAVNTSYKELIERLQSEGIESPSDYERLIGQKEEITQSLNELKQIEAQIGELRSSIDSAYWDLIECRKRLSKNRLAFLKENLTENPSIKVNLEPLSDTSNLESSFRSKLGRQDSAFSSEIYDSDRECGFLYSLNQRITSESSNSNQLEMDSCFSRVHDFKEQLFNFNSGEVEGTKLGKRFIDFMSQLPAQTFDEMTTWFPDDKLSIKFSDGKRFKDVSQGSAGQKASAILSFLLSYGTEPLVLDQPEDDLDNGLISSLIVTKIQENKSERQIIVVTHNPNIVVNGDSEFVVALEDRGEIHSIASGALQEEDVRKNVCEIMEGGELALQRRYKRMFNTLKTG